MAGPDFQEGGLDQRPIVAAQSRLAMARPSEEDRERIFLFRARRDRNDQVVQSVPSSERYKLFDATVRTNAVARQNLLEIETKPLTEFIPESFAHLGQCLIRKSRGRIRSGRI